MQGACYPGFLTTSSIELNRERSPCPQRSGCARALSQYAHRLRVSNAKAITAFSLQGLTPTVTGFINELAHTIALTITRPIDLHALVATFTTTGASVTVLSLIHI